MNHASNGPSNAVEVDFDTQERAQLLVIRWIEKSALDSIAGAWLIWKMHASAKNAVIHVLLHSESGKRDTTQSRIVTNYLDQNQLIPSELSQELREEMAQNLEYKHLSTGEVLCWQGEPGNDYFIVIKGYLKGYSLDDAGQVGELLEAVRKARQEGGQAAPLPFRAFRARAGRALSTFKDDRGLGELSLITGQPRALTVVADGPVCLGRVAAPLYKRVLHRWHVQRDRLPEILFLLKQQGCFGNWASFHINQLATAMTVLNLQKGECLLRQGEPLKTVYLLVTGAVHLSSVEESNPGETEAVLAVEVAGQRTNSKKEVALGQVGKGSLLGAAEALAGGRRAYALTATAAAPAAAPTPPAAAAGASAPAAGGGKGGALSRSVSVGSVAGAGGGGAAALAPPGVAVKALALPAGLFKHYFLDLYPATAEWARGAAAVVSSRRDLAGRRLGESRRRSSHLARLHTTAGFRPAPGLAAAERRRGTISASLARKDTLSQLQALQALKKAEDRSDQASEKDSDEDSVQSHIFGADRESEALAAGFSEPADAAGGPPPRRSLERRWALGPRPLALMSPDGGGGGGGSGESGGDVAAAAIAGPGNRAESNARTFSFEELQRLERREEAEAAGGAAAWGEEKGCGSGSRGKLEPLSIGAEKNAPAGQNNSKYSGASFGEVSQKDKSEIAQLVLMRRASSAASVGVGALNAPAAGALPPPSSDPGGPDLGAATPFATARTARRHSALLARHPSSSRRGSSASPAPLPPSHSLLSLSPGLPGDQGPPSTRKSLGSFPLGSASASPGQPSGRRSLGGGGGGGGSLSLSPGQPSGRRASAMGSSRRHSLASGGGGLARGGARPRGASEAQALLGDRTPLARRASGTGFPAQQESPQLRPLLAPVAALSKHHTPMGPASTGGGGAGKARRRRSAAAAAAAGAAGGGGARLPRMAGSHSCSPVMSPALMSPAGMLQYEGGIFDFGKALLNDAFPAESPAEKKKTLLRNHSSPAILSPVNEAASAGHKFFDFDSSKEGQERQKETHQLRTPAKKNNGGQSLYFSTPGGPNITGGSSLVQTSVPSSPGHQLRTPVMRKSLSSSTHPTTSKKLLPVSKSQDYEQYGSTKGGAPSLELPHSRTPSSKAAGSVPGAGAAPTGEQSNMEVLIAQLKTDTDGQIDGMLWKRAPAASAAAGRL